MSKTPLLSDELKLPERIALGQLIQHPGLGVLQNILKSECVRATEDVIKLDPSEEGYERKLKSLQSRARFMNEFCADVLKSIGWQVQAGEIEDAARKRVEAEEQLAKTKSSKGMK